MLQSEVGEHRDGSGVNPGSEMTNMEPTPGSLVQVMLAAMRDENRARNRKTEARAAHLARSRFVDPKEPIEHARHRVGGNADARVDDFDRRRPARLPRGNRHAPPRLL